MCVCLCVCVCTSSSVPCDVPADAELQRVWKHCKREPPSGYEEGAGLSGEVGH